jgi:hypothetical protein
MRCGRDKNEGSIEERNEGKDVSGARGRRVKKFKKKWELLV